MIGPEACLFSGILTENLKPDVQSLLLNIDYIVPGVSKVFMDWAAVFLQQRFSSKSMPGPCCRCLPPSPACALAQPGTPLLSCLVSIDTCCAAQNRSQTTWVQNQHPHCTSCTVVSSAAQPPPLSYCPLR